jgi:hypothetical protein
VTLIWFCDLTSENFAETAVFRCFPIDATCAGCASRDQQIAGRLGPGNRCTEEAPHRASVRGTEKRAELEMALTHLETVETAYLKALSEVKSEEKFESQSGLKRLDT